MNFKEISNKYPNINLKYIKYFNNIINYNSINTLKYLLEHESIVYSFESFIEKYNIINFDSYLLKYESKFVILYFSMKLSNEYTIVSCSNKYFKALILL